MIGTGYLCLFGAKNENSSGVAAIIGLFWYNENTNEQDSTGAELVALYAFDYETSPTEEFPYYQETKWLYNSELTDEIKYPFSGTVIGVADTVFDSDVVKSRFAYKDNLLEFLKTGIESKFTEPKVEGDFKVFGRIILLH